MAALVVVGCAPRPPAAGPAPARAEPVVALERTACLGACPVYSVSIFASGRVAYDGRAHVRHLGAAEARLAPAEVEALVAELASAGYFDYADRYTARSPACGRYAADAPGAITTVRRGGRIKRIEHDHGCGEAPRRLAELERRIDQVAKTARWTGS